MKVIRATYRDIDQEKPCPACHAMPLQFCTNAITGEYRRVPCARRPRVQAAQSVMGDFIDAEVVDVEELDFSEPRHIQPSIDERTP
ncbi:hypothetical protein [Mycolicibacterium frederiksbergense]|uniref:hypothetical protein n=1 Tax=Mycolicibacterium frederiksbergense TaxID=117567 RepID=UPI00265BA1F0|nr:hypothetical protein [Mycolicibacterium frederiksbergense]MBX9920809.1 hypothetical protein [Mycolicibacterium frederiksbergense]MDO0975985.1 hypothetical protein [Mycolicibacterium frederiksbergense]